MDEALVAMLEAFINDPHSFSIYAVVGIAMKAKEEIERLAEYEWKYNDLCK